MREKKIFFVVGNHRQIVGIKDYLNIAKELFYNYQIVIKKEIQKNSINILVENFKSKEVDKIIHYKKKYNSKIILVLTEFINKKAETYNSFELKKKIYKFIPFNLFSLLNIWILCFLFYFIIVILFFDFKLSSFYILFIILAYILIKKKYYDLKQVLKKILIKHTQFNLKKYRNFKKKFFNLKKKKKNKFNIRKTKFFIKLVKFRYFKERYIQANRLIKVSHMLLVSHPAIYKYYDKNRYKIYYIFPMIKSFKPNKIKNFSKTFKFSGELTDYRFSYFDKIKKKLLFSKKNILVSYYDFFNRIKNRRNEFIDIKFNQKYKYSLHPKKSYEWQFSSPIRYINAIKNGELPIIFNNFTDIVSKNLTFYLNISSKKELFKFFKDENKKLRKFKKGIIKYNLFVKNNKNEIIKETKKLEAKIENR